MLAVAKGRRPSREAHLQRRTMEGCALIETESSVVSSRLRDVQSADDVLGVVSPFAQMPKKRNAE
jgi:hypothetical protein